MPHPKKNEEKKEFIQRCMAYPDMQDKPADQRYAICQQLWNDKGKAETNDETNKDK